MPSYKCKEGGSYEIQTWPGTSYKAIVINRALDAGQFWVRELNGKSFMLFECSWCKQPVTSSGVQGDHVVQQNTLKGSSEMRGLFYNVNGDSFGLALSCAECNGGTRNSSGMHTRSTFAIARATQQPVRANSSMSDG